MSSSHHLLPFPHQQYCMLPKSPKITTFALCNQYTSEDTVPYSEYLSSVLHEYPYNPIPTEHPYNPNQYTINPSTIQQNNRKQRIIRSAHYRSQSEHQLTTNRNTLQQEGVKGKSIKMKAHPNQTKKRLIRSALGTRSQPHLSQFPTYLTPTRFKSSSHATPLPPQTVFQLPVNPHAHVIYPFESRMRVKRVDDNPVVLSRVIEKKSRQVSRGELYQFINGLISRRLK